jgi:nucleoside-diphosphate-sugar epimerase
MEATMAISSGLHVVLGATGGVGQRIARMLADQGAQVRAVNRGGHPVEGAATVEVKAADLTNRESALAACQGASVVYHCAGAPYSQWATVFPVMLDNIIAAASDTGATLVYTDNCYMYSPSAQPLTEDSPQQPITRKGKLRKQLADMLLAAHTQGRIRATIGRASDFYGPGVRSSMVGEQVFGAIVRGKRVPWLGKLAVPHAFSYVDDFARGLITLGAHDQALGQVWHIPAAPALTGREFLGLAGDAAGARVRPLPISGTMMRVLGLTTPVLRETRELLYEYNEPYLFDGGKYTSAFGGAPTPHQEAMRQTVAWFREHDSV